MNPAYIKSLLTPPIFKDERKAHQAYILNIILWMLIALVIPYLVLSLIFSPQTMVEDILMSVIGLVISGALLVLMRRGHVQLASTLQVISFWLLLNITAFFLGGIQGPAYLAGNMLVISLAGILLGPVYAGGVIVLSLLYGGLLVYLETAHVYVFAYDPPLNGYWVVGLFFFVIIFVLPEIAYRAMRKAFNRASESEKKYRTILDSIQDGFYRIDLQGMLTMISPSGVRIFGYESEQEILGHPITESTYRSLEIRQEFLHTLQEHGMVSDYELTLAHKDGTPLIVATSGHYYYDEQGNIAGIEGTFRDITAQWKAEQQYRQSAEKFAKVFQLVPDGIAITRLDDGTILDINPSMETITGFSREDSIGMTTHDLDFWTNPADREQMFAELRQHGEVLYRETTYRHKDGEIRSALLSARTVDLGPEKIIINVLQDITDRKQAEADRLEGEERYRALFKNNHSVMLLIDPNNGAIVDANPAACSYYGWSMEQITKKKIHEINTLSPAEIEIEMKAAFNERRSFFQFQHRLADGSIRDVEVYSGPIQVEGKTVLYSIIQDVTSRRLAETAQKQSEERFQTLFDRMLDGVYRSTHDGKFVAINPAMVNMFGYASIEEMLQIDIKKELYFAPEERGSHILDTGQEEMDLYRMRRKDGSEIWVEDHGYYVHNEQGNIIYHEGILRDVTERIRNEEHIRLISAMLDVAPASITIHDTNGRFLYANKKTFEIHGYEEQEFMALNLHDVDVPESEALINERMQLIEQFGEASFEVSHYHKNHSIMPMEVTVKKVYWGGIPAMLSIATDITARKHHESELEAVATVSSALRNAPTRAQMLPVILNQIMALLNAEGASLEILTPNNGGLRTELGCGVMEPLTGTIQPTGAGLSGYVFTTGQPYLNNDAAHDPHIYSPDAFGGCNAAAASPLIVQGQIIGLIWVTSKRPLLDHDLHLLTTIAEMAANAIQRASLHEQTVQQVQRLSALRTVDQTITSSIDQRLTLHVIVEQASTQLKADAAAVLLLKQHSHSLEFAAGYGFRTRNIEHCPIRLGEGQAGRAALERRTLTFPTIDPGDPHLLRALDLEREGFVSHHVTPLVVKGQVRGVLEVFHRSTLTPDPEWLDFFETLAGQAAIAIDNTQLFEDLQHTNLELGLAYDATIEGWSRALDLRDRETEGHTLRVADLTMKLAQALGIGGEQIVHIRRGALLHDMGKLAVPDSILLKPGKLTDEEWEIMRQHPQYAFDMLAPVSYLRPSLDIPYCHHEKWDGTGYPRGLKGEQIPLPARLFAVVDVWDALLSDRPYRPAWTKDKTLAYIREQAGTHFDRRVVETFLKICRDL